MASFIDTFPEGTKNLLILNVLVFIGCYIDQSLMVKLFALFAFSSPFFKVWQLFTYMFLHGGFFHIFFNMYTLSMFGTVVERTIGTKKFLTLYFVSGLGAGVVNALVLTAAGQVYVPTVGASGAIYGVLIAYAMLYPQSRMTLIFPPVSMTAKWMVGIFALIELFTGVVGTSDGIAHFAHLGGMVFGALLIFIWKKRGDIWNRW